MRYDSHAHARTHTVGELQCCCWPQPVAALSLQSHTRMCEFHILQVSSISQQWNLHTCLNPDTQKGQMSLLVCLVSAVNMKVVPRTMMMMIIINYHYNYNNNNDDNYYNYNDGRQPAVENQ